MKKIKLLLVGAVILAALIASSCDKGTESPNKDYLHNITGNYTGEFISSETGDTSSGVAEVSPVDNDQLQVHCYGDIIDTTLIMNVYEDGDSVMVCDTSLDFTDDHDMMGEQGSMMDEDPDETEWMHHLSYNHDQMDLQYGSFDMPHHTFRYTFTMGEGDSTYELMFSGRKN